MGHEPKQCLLLQLLPLKGVVEQGKEQDPAMRFPLGRGSRDPQGRGWGCGLRACLRHRLRMGVGSCGLHLRRREGGGDLRWRLWNWIWNGIGSDRGWAVVTKVKEEEENSEQGSGDIVLGGCDPAWAKSI